MDNKKQNPVATIEMENGGTIKIELYPEVAPNSVSNFIELANDEKYDGTIFHRVIPGFMVQGGDPLGTGTGGPGWTIKGEFSNNGFPNDLSHERGVISMARSMMKDSAGCQFFIMVAESKFLDGEYAAFGKVLDDESMLVVDEIVGAKRNSSDRPDEDQRMKKVRVELFGQEYGPTKKL